MRGNRTTTGQEGVALISAIWLTIVVMGVVTTGTIILRSHRSQTRIAFAKNSQALQIARSGLVEARSWLRRQTSQPVTDFVPVLDPGADPPVLDTIEPDIGIVREFRITGQTWARYEVWKQWDADPVPARLALRQQLQCEDISAARQANGEGVVWRLRCMGYIFNRGDENVAFDVQPNYVIAKELLEVEVERLLLQLPGEGAVNVSDGNNCHVNTMGRIIGGANGAGIFYPAGTGTPTTGPNNQNRVTGTPRLSSTSDPYDDSYEAVFSLSLSEIKAMASMVLTDMSQFPVPVPEGSIIVVEQASINFDSSQPLTGNGLVILVGNVNIANGSNSNFSGFLYVDGGFTMRAPAEIRGAVIVTGNMTLQGSADYATIQYDEDVLSGLRAMFGSYNVSSSFKRLLNQE
ncbi:MAG: hypothetical protein KDC98_14655 [Planctomycetes bacterium]|nr:hypothetical protein [Planctomycetota bacterium]